MYRYVYRRANLHGYKFCILIRITRYWITHTYPAEMLCCINNDLFTLYYISFKLGGVVSYKDIHTQLISLYDKIKGIT